MKLKIRESNLISLNEMTLNRLVRGHSVDGYTILSACRGMFDKDENAVYFENGIPYRWKDDTIVADEDLMSDSDVVVTNNKKSNELKKILIGNKYSFLPVLGGYTYDDGTFGYEKSFVIFPFDKKGNQVRFSELYSFTIELGNRFEQESVLINSLDSNPYYYDMRTGEKSVEFSSNPDDWKINDLTQEFFTALKKYDTKKFPNYVGKSQRFTLEGVYLSDQPDTISSAHIRRSGGELCMPLSAWKRGKDGVL